MKRAAKSMDEQDVAESKQFYSYLARPGVSARIKRRMRRRERHEARRSLQHGQQR